MPGRNPCSEFEARNLSLQNIPGAVNSFPWIAAPRGALSNNLDNPARRFPIPRRDRIIRSERVVQGASEEPAEARDD